MSRKKLFYLVGSFAVSVFLIWFLLSQIEIRDLGLIFANIYYPALFSFLLLSLTGAALRAWRYKWLLLPQKITWGNIFLVTFIRNLFVDLLPARIGSLSYVYILNKRLEYTFETAASTFVISFVLDFLTLSPFIILAVFIVGLGATGVPSQSLLVISILFLAAVFVFFWRLIPIMNAILALYRYLLRKGSLDKNKWAVHSLDKLKLTLEALSSIKDRRIYWRLFLLSLGIRLAKYFSLYSLLFALIRSQGFLLKTLSFWKTVLGITGAEMTGALPIIGIGGFGTWESGWALAFRLMDFEPRIAVLSGIGVHLITNLFEYMLGIGAILILALPTIRKKNSTARSLPRKHL